MRIGVCFEWQIVSDVCSGPHDESVSFLITENGVIEVK
jgi:5-formyltetrahydrofolate cyclo-ligase